MWRSRARGAALALLTILALLAWPPGAVSTPLSKAEVIKLLRRNVREQRLLAVVRELGMDFVITAEVIEELIAAGAGSALVAELLALASAKRDVVSVVTPPPAPVEPPSGSAGSAPPGERDSPSTDRPSMVPSPEPPPAPEPPAAGRGTPEGLISLIPPPPVPPPPVPTPSGPSADLPRDGGAAAASPPAPATSEPSAGGSTTPAPAPNPPAPPPGPPAPAAGAPGAIPDSPAGVTAAPAARPSREPSKWEQVKPLLDRAQAVAIEGDIREAQALVAKAMEIDPGEPEVWKAFKDIEHDLLVRAEGFLADGQVRRALREFQLIITRNPESSAGHAGVGLALLQLKNYQEAVVAFERALALDPGNARYRQSLTQAKNLQKATRALEQTGQENLQQMLGDQPGKKREP